MGKKVVSLLAAFSMVISMFSIVPEQAKAAVKTIYVTKGESIDISVKKATKKTKWKASKKSVVKTTAKKGKIVVKGLKKGTTTIKAKVGKKTAQFKVVVEKPSISKKEVTLEVSKTMQIQMKGTARKVVWKSTDGEVATVTNSGKITAKKAGSASVYAKIGKKKYSCKVVVNETKKDIEQPSDQKKEVVINREEDDKIELMVQNGDCQVHCDVYRPAATKKCPAIIMTHGINGCGRDFTNECFYFRKQGIIGVSIDVVGGTKPPRCKSIGKTTTELTVESEKSDILAVFDYIRALDYVDENNVFLFGGSMGGFVTALAAEERADQVRGMALYYPAFCIPDNWRATYPDVTKIPETTSLFDNTITLGRQFFVEIHDMNTFDIIGKKYQGPVFIAHGDQDGIANINDSKRAVEETYKNADLLVIKDAGHGFNLKDGKFAMEEVLYFMKDNIKK